MKMHSVLYSLFLLVFCSGCANIAPWRPHGHTDYRAAELTSWEKQKHVELETDSPKVLLVGQVDDQTIPPLGALYHEESFAEAPLVEVYHIANPGRLLANALPEQLNAAGIRSYRDASDLGDAVNGEGVFPKGLLVLRLELTSLTYARHTEGFDALLGDYQVHVYSADTNEKLYSLKRDFRIKNTWNMKAMVLPTDGFKTMAESIVRNLLQDTAFINLVRGS